MIYRIVILIMVIIVSCKNENNNKPVFPEINNDSRSTAPDKGEIANIEVKTFEINGGWGYDIYVNDETYIHQEHIPAVNGLNPFKTAADANKVGDLMAHKIRNNMMPPTITIEELNSMGIDF